MDQQEEPQRQGVGPAGRRVWLRQRLMAQRRGGFGMGQRGGFGQGAGGGRFPLLAMLLQGRQGRGFQGQGRLGRGLGLAGRAFEGPAGPDAPAAGDQREMLVQRAARLEKLLQTTYEQIEQLDAQSAKAEPEVVEDGAAAPEEPGRP